MIFVLLIFILDESNSSMEPFVVGGNRSAIEYFAHSGFLSIRDYQGAYICGSSILNQKVLLSAAHCFESCDSAGNVYAFVGNAHKSRGRKYQVSKVKIHEHYDPVEVRNDIGLVVLRVSLRLGDNVKRISIIRNPPPRKLAVVAGWGLIDLKESRAYAFRLCNKSFMVGNASTRSLDLGGVITTRIAYHQEKNGVRSSWLHSTKQKVWSLTECRKILVGIPKGCLCGGDMSDKSYASEGDSGSALVINGFIQVGLVSFKRPDVSRGLVVYTNVSQFYNWIKTNSKILYCRDQAG